MKIKVIRPASRQSTDAEFMEASARLTSSYASAGTEVETVFLSLGQHGGSMGGYLNEARIMSAAPTLLKEVVKAQADGWDAVVISGEYDVGAEIARHLVSIPVIDVGSTSVRFAPLLGDRAVMLVTQELRTFLCAQVASTMGDERFHRSDDGMERSAGGGLGASRGNAGAYPADLPRDDETERYQRDPSILRRFRPLYCQATRP